MHTFSRILVPTDLSASAHRALDHAAALAERYDAELRVLHVVPTAGGDPFTAFFRRLSDGGRLPDEMREDLAHRIEQTLRDRTHGHARVSHVHVQGAEPATAIIDYARTWEADLIVLGTHGHRGLTHLALGGTSGAVLRQAPCAVMTVREEELAREPPDAAGAPDVLGPAPTYHHVVAAIDFSEASRDALSAARALAAHFDTTLSLLFVAEERVVPLFSDTGLPALTTLRLDPEAFSRADAALRQLYADVGGPEVGFQVHVRSGLPAREILLLAEEAGADLIVLGAHGHSGDEFFSLGGTAERVVRQAQCPVLSLKPASSV